MLPFISGAPAIISSVPVLPTLTLVDGNLIDADGTTKTYSNQSFGSEDATRILIAQIGLRQAGTSSTAGSCTIGGVTATKLIDMVFATDNRLIMFVASVPTGTTGSVIFTFPHTVHRCGYVLHRGTKLNPNPIDTDASSGTGALGHILNVSSSSFVLGSSWHVSASSGPTWTGTSITQDAGFTVESTAVMSSAKTPQVSGSLWDINVNYSGSFNRGLISASFAEAA